MIKTVGDRIKEQRELNNMSQVELAKRWVFLNRHYISMKTMP